MTVGEIPYSADISESLKSSLYFPPVRPLVKAKLIDDYYMYMY